MTGEKVPAELGIFSPAVTNEQDKTIVETCSCDVLNENFVHLQGPTIFLSDKNSHILVIR
jgi:hypothetical protein